MAKAEKKSGTTLIITEKPQAADKIAAALSDGKDKKVTNKNKVSYYEFSRGGEDFVVGCAVGHLFGIGAKEKKGRRDIPDFDVEWQPNYKKKSAEFTKKYFDVLRKLAKDADKFIIATDYDVEGEVIGWNVLRFICKKEDAMRMKFSSLTKPELEKSFDNVMKNIDWGQAIAGETRHYLDWFYGINLSRALMRSISKAGTFRILSIGRVQGPALSIVVDKELEIQKFKSEPYWQIFLQIQDIKKQKLEVHFPKDVKKKSELLKFKHLKGKKGVAKTITKDEEIKAPIPFDLTTLQTECYRYFGLTPTQTLQIAQKLYLAGLISYPRTSSQQYPVEIGYDKILKQIKKHFTIVKHAQNTEPTEGKKTDPAHPAIYPTGEWKKMEGLNQKVYQLIVKRFISCFCNPAISESRRVEINVEGLKFSANGAVIKEKNWMNVYPTSFKEAKIPEINGEVDINEIRIEEKQTKPPKRWSAASLVRELEKKNLGTKATRASITETLYTRGYIREKSIEVTPLGLALVKSLKENSPIILHEDLTRDIEKELEEILKSKDKKIVEKEGKIMDRAKKDLTEIIMDMRKKEEKMGKVLGAANKNLIQEEIKNNTLTECPTCKKGNLRILFARQYQRYFIGCTNYPNCKQTYTLPPRGKLVPAMKKNEESVEENELCDFCKSPLMISLKKGSRPWKFCFNSECESRKEYEKNKKKKSFKGKSRKKVVKKED
jgi:DNA topoisomerase I